MTNMHNAARGAANGGARPDAENIAHALGGATKGTEGWWHARCPAHDDRKASLALHDAEDGGVARKCMAGCDSRAVAAALQARGLLPEHPKARDSRRGRIVACYDYRDEAGMLLFQVVRFDPKDFRQRRPDPAGKDGWIWQLGDVRRVLYRLPELLGADPNEPVLVVEGEKDADKLAALGFIATTNPQGAGKWARTDRAALAGRHVVVLPDNDEPGRKHAAEIARDLDDKAASVRVLTLPGLPGKGDVSDWIARGGTAEGLRAMIAGAEPDRREDAAGSSEWPEPERLTSADAEPQPYPLDVLPADVAAAVAEYQGYGRQPVPLIVASALGAMSLCAQGLVDVRRDRQLLGPVSLNLKVVAESGERKTAADKAFTAEIRAWEKDEAKRLAPVVAEAKQALESLETQRTGLKAKLRDLSGRKRSPERDADIEAIKGELAELDRNAPRLPPVPVPFMENGTIEGMTRDLRYSWPSSSWWSNEGGAVVGGHGFAEDARTRTLAFINQRWDGSPFDRRRAGQEDSFGATHGRRLTSCVMLQPIAFAAYAEAGNGAARGLGSVARDLLCWPASTMGTRLRAEDGDGDDELPALARFNERVCELLSVPLPMVGEADEQGEPNPDPLELRPFELRLSPAARRQWIAYSNECEVQLLPEGELADVRDVAAKSAENACRLAAIFHVWQHGQHGEIGSADMGRGIALARWYVFEARRVLGLAPEDAAAENAELLARWVGSQDEPPTLKAVSQLGPYRVRKKAPRDAAIALLIDRGWLRYGKRHGATALILNPQITVEG